MYRGIEHAWLPPELQGTLLMHSQQLEARPVRCATVAVVDPQAGDYRAVLDTPLGTELRWQFLSCGRDALRLSQAEEVDLWVVHLSLPDMSGLELCELLKTRLCRPVIYAVSDEYCAEDERAARARGASLFGCKPVQACWFEPWARLPELGRGDRRLAGSPTPYAPL
jgi:CheY-like chemotaxis protein